MKKESIRHLRVAKQLKEILSDIFNRNLIREEGHDKIEVTVTNVKVSASLQDATIFVMPLDKSSQQPLVEELNSRIPSIRHFVAKKLPLKFVPNLRFILDESFDQADRIGELLKNLRKS